MRFRESLSAIFHYAGWPIVCGLLIALLYLQYRGPTASTNSSLLPERPPYSYADAVQRAIPSVVNIYARTHVRPLIRSNENPFFQYFYNVPQQNHVQNSLGSGVIINDKGYLLTNFHVIDGADEIVVLLNDGRESIPKVVGSDPEIDLAVLKIDLPDLTAITPGDIDDARVGDVVLAIGNPYGVGQTVTQGIISASSRDGLRVTTNYIQTDAAINPGNSGGALIDANGKLLGINTRIISETGASIGIGFAIPVDTAMKVLNDITRYGHVRRSALGIVTKAVPPHIARRVGLTEGAGLLITAIYTRGPAHEAGLLPGDIIVQMNGHLITGDQAGLDTIAKSPPGESASIVINRRGKLLTTSIVPGIRNNR